MEQMSLKSWGNLELEQEKPSNQEGLWESAANSRRELVGRKLVLAFCGTSVCKMLEKE